MSIFPVGRDAREHDVFLSSAWYGLDSIRANLADWFSSNGYKAFVFENFKDEANWKALVPAGREAICLENVGRSRLYVGVFRTTYGSSARLHAADVAFTDLEFFEAFRSSVPMRLYVLEDTPSENKLRALLTIIEVVAPGTVQRFISEAELLYKVKADTDVFFERARPSVSLGDSGRYARATIAHRHVVDDRSEGLSFLLDAYPEPKLPFDPDLVREELDQIQVLPSYDQRINACWHVLQRLFNVPWRENPAYLCLWEEALRAWDNAAAWRGLHGFLFAGRLAACNTLVSVRVLIASAGEMSTLAELVRKGEPDTGTRDEWVNLYSTGGNLASEYYSIAKLAPPVWKSHYLEKADSWISVGERALARHEDRKREAGLTSIRGHILLEWGRRAEAIRLLERSLRLREDAGLGAASIGEALVDLGYAHHIAGHRRKAEHLVERGLSELQSHSSPAFLARAKRKAARVYARGWAFRKALAELVEVHDLVEAHGLTDQGRETRWLAQLPEFVRDGFRNLPGPR